MSCHALLQGIFLTQGSNPCLLWLLHCRHSLPLIHWEIPFCFPTGLYLQHPPVSKETISKKVIVTMFFLRQILLLKRFISDFVLGSPGNLCVFTWLYFYQIKQNVKLDIVSVFIALRNQHRNFPQTGDFWHSIAFI